MVNEVEAVADAVANPDKMWAYLGAGFCGAAITIVALGLAKLWVTVIETVGRNPQVKKDVTGFALIGMGSIEAIALYVFVLAILMII